MTRIVGWIILLTLCAALSRAAVADVPYDRKSFTDHVLAIATNNFPDRNFSLGKQPMQIVCGPIGINLDNLYRVVAAKQPADADAEILKFLSNAMSAATEQLGKKTASWEEIQPKLRPQLIPVEYLKLGKSFLYESCPFSKDLLLGYVVDSPDTISFVRPDDVKAWSVDLGTLNKLAFTNLENASRQLPDRIQDHGPGGKGRWLAISLADGYDATRILLPQLRKRIEDQLGSPFYAAIPNRDFLICWSKDYWKADQFAAEVKQDYQTKNHQMSPDVYMVKGREIRSVENEK